MKIHSVALKGKDLALSLLLSMLMTDTHNSQQRIYGLFLLLNGIKSFS